MPRASRSALALALVAATLLVAVPAQAAVPQSVDSVWSRLLDGWVSWTAALTGPSEQENRPLSVAVGQAGPSVTNSVTPGSQPPDADIQSTESNTLDPDELPTEEGPSISPDG